MIPSSIVPMSLIHHFYECRKTLQHLLSDRSSYSLTVITQQKMHSVTRRQYNNDLWCYWTINLSKKCTLSSSNILYVKYSKSSDTISYHQNCHLNSVSNWVRYNFQYKQMLHWFNCMGIQTNPKWNNYSSYKYSRQCTLNSKMTVKSVHKIYRKLNSYNCQRWFSKNFQKTNATVSNKVLTI